ncbi:hypothetical protein SBRCBS47491_005909 [Sporothrix bragantina]|uniref:C2H2-type domain-containing protein n=1 Tax=Sporothrix bragantina TaxID=671064 RepID=A0ABP0C2M9_9PEZI
MAVDSSQGRFALGGYDNMHPYAQHHHAGPHFTNPWTAPSASATNQQPTASSSMYGNLSQHTSLSGMEGLRPQHPQQLPQPIPQQQQHHQQPPHPHHAQQQQQQQHSPISQQHHQAPSHHQQQQTQQPQYHSQHQHQQQPPRLPQPTSQQQQQLPPAPMHRPSSTNLPSPMAMGMPATQSQSPHSRTTVADPVGYRNDLLIATTSAAYPDSTAAYSAPSPIHPTAAYATAGAPGPYDQMGYAPATHLRGAPGAGAAGFGLDANAAADVARRFSQPDNSHAVLSSAGAESRRGFQEALEASHGILSLSQDTPRPIAYPGQNGQGAAGRGSRGSADYGFPQAHSTSSSISSNSFNSFYGGGSVDSNISDYSTSGSDLESVSSRHRHMPAGMHAGMGGGMGSGSGMQHRASFVSSVPPSAHSMMGQFNSKVTSTAQKKHKCKVCEKRFTRPSSLQTHMYSHTGEKPFACDVPGCGRNFSVVSNLRRHKKVHKDLSPSETGSEDHHHSPE